MALWSAAGRPRWLYLLLAYLLALGVVELAQRFKLLPPLTGRALALLGSLLALPGLGFPYKARARSPSQSRTMACRT